MMAAAAVLASSPWAASDPTPQAQASANDGSGPARQVTLIVVLFLRVSMVSPGVSRRQMAALVFHRWPSLVFGCHLLLLRSRGGRLWCGLGCGSGYGIGDAGVRGHRATTRPSRTARARAEAGPLLSVRRPVRSDARRDLGE